MKTNPQSEQQIREEMLFPEGIYDFEVKSAVAKLSKKGNEMIELKIVIFSAEGRTQFVTDYLMEKPPMMKFKLLHFCDSTLTMEAYNSDNLHAEDLVGREGRVSFAATPKRTTPASTQRSRPRLSA